MAGWPVTLNGGVKGTTSAARKRPWSGLSGGLSKVPSGGGGSAMVGVSSRSWPSVHQAATSRAFTCSHSRAESQSAALPERPTSASAQVSGSTSSAVTVSPVRRLQ